MRIRHAFLMMVLVLIAPVTSAADTQLTVYAVNYPLKYFAERIGGDHITVHFPAPAGVDPAYWTPDILSIAEFQKADLILLNGAGYAKWTGKVSLPRSKLLNTSKSFREQYIRATETVTHSHGPKGDHAHEDLAFTTWLDFSMAVEQARAIKAVLSRKRPGQESIFEKNFQMLEKELLELDRTLKALVSQNPSQPLVVSHPVYDYFTRRYNLSTKSVHWEPDEIPSQEQLNELQKILKDHPAKGMIWEGVPLKKSVKLLKDYHNIESLVFDPCGNTPDKGDFLVVMRQNIENLKTAF